MSSKYTFAANIPLIGGFPLAAESVLGKPPEFVTGYTGFGKHDGQYMNWLNVTNDHKVKYYNLDEEYPTQKADIIVSTPPCSGLSTMNCSKCGTKSGSDAAVNVWMYRSLEDNIDKLRAKVVITENAPGLYGPRGQGVADKLTKIAHDRGYSVAFYKTTSVLHGIPQDRIRTFFFAFQSETAPILDWHAKPHKPWHEYITDIPKDATQMTDLFNAKLTTADGYYTYLKHLGVDVRKDLLEQDCATAYWYVYRNGLLDDFIEFYKEKNPRWHKDAVHAKTKLAAGLGIWDASVMIKHEMFNAFVGRNSTNTLHPFEDRSLSLREGMHMMAMPHNFELLGGVKNQNMICQNVPVCTAADMVRQAVKFLDGKLPNSGLTMIRQNNVKRTIDTPIVGAKFDHI